MFRHFWIVHQILNIFKKKKKMTLIAHVFRKLRNPKNVVEGVSKKSLFRGPFDKQHCKRDQIMLISERNQLYHILWSLFMQLSWKKPVLVTCKVLRMFVNVFNADSKCFLLNRDNLRQPIQMPLSEKQKKISKFFSAISKSKLNFELFWTEDDPHSWCISETTHSKNVVKQMSKKSRFREPWDKQHGKEAKTIFKNFNIFINYCESNWAGKNLS